VFQTIFKKIQSVSLAETSSIHSAVSVMIVHLAILATEVFMRLIEAALIVNQRITFAWNVTMQDVQNAHKAFLIQEGNALRAQL